MTKQQLYCSIENIRVRFGAGYPLPYDAKELCTSAFGLHFDSTDLKTPKLRGAAHLPSHSVIIDSKMTDLEQNFYCMHEIMHHILHKSRPTKVYSCYDKTPANQDTFIEWEANEGAAQFLVPYQSFVPLFSSLLDSPPFSPSCFAAYLASCYNVSEPVIINRIDNLGYEIDQYRRGIPIDRIEILSKTQQKRRGIPPPRNYNAVCAFASAI